MLPLRWLGAGVAIAVCLHPWGPPPEGAGVVRTWVSDRGAQALVGLDRDLFVAGVVAWPWPVGLEAAPGGLWVLAAPAGHPGGGHRLSRARVEGGTCTEVAALELGRVLDLAAAPDGGVAWLERVGAGGVRVGRVDRRGRARSLAAPPGSSCLAVSASGLLVGTAEGSSWLLRPERGGARWVRGAEHRGPVLDVAADPEGGWWLLAAGGGALELVFTGPDLGVRRRVRLEGRAGRLAADGEGALVAIDGAGARCLRVGRDGRVASLGAPALRGVQAVLPTGAGGALVVYPGAVLRYEGLGSGGGALPGQGGFDHLVDAVLAGPGAGMRGHAGAARP